MKFLFGIFISAVLLSNYCFAQIGGYAIKFDGSDDYIYAQNTSSLTFSAFTLEAWIFPLNTDSKIIGKTESSGAVPGFNMGMGPTLYCECKQDWGSNYVSGSSTQSIPTGVWTHVAMTWSSGGYLKGYINGVEVISKSSPSLSVNGSNNFVIGRAPWTNMNQGAFSGRMDEVRVWNVVRTQAEIKANMYREIGTNTNLKVYYKMSNGSGTTVTDNSGNGYSGIFSSSPVWTASGCFTGPKNCLDFDGVNDYVDFGSPAATRITNNMTISAWVKTSATGSSGYKDIITNQWLINQSGFLLGMALATGKIHYSFSAPSSTSDNHDVDFIINDNVWHFIAVTFSSGTIKTYVDGRLIDTYVSTCTSIVYNGGICLDIGRDSGTSLEYWMGDIDDVSIWNVVLSDSLIKENMTKSLAGNESGLVAYYNFDYSDGTVLYDVTSNGINGTLTNFALSGATGNWIASTAYNTWIGSENTGWSTAANWSKGSVPAPTDNPGIYKWALGNELSLSGSPSLNHIVFSSTSSPTLSSNFTTNGDLILNRDINLNGYTIILGSSGYLIEGNYRLYGASGSITTTRTLNNISAQNIGGLGVTLTTAANMGSTTITRCHASQGSNNSIFRYFDITPATNTGLNATLVFNYNDNEMNGNTESSLKLFKSTNSGTNWIAQNSSVVNTAANTITLSGIDGFSRWTAANSNSPMPVELISFSSAVNGRNVILVWKTEKEINNSGFEIQRYFSGTEWKDIAYLNGSGTTQNANTYSFTDYKLNSGKYNYRLKQIDYNGNFSYLYLNGIVEIGIPSNFSMSQNYPNPFNPATKIDFQLHRNGKVFLAVYDVSGREVAKLLNNEFKNADYYTVTFDAANLSSGIYYYILAIDNKQISIKKMALVK
ncbi:MAG: T9SS type A sorting domain-containing protein [Ignavibacteria bacterium]|nr:T9SS type A sorting domain-containing protein [Ignavibacteria bacterium]